MAWTETTTRGRRVAGPATHETGFAPSTHFCIPVVRLPMRVELCPGRQLRDLLQVVGTRARSAGSSRKTSLLGPVLFLEPLICDTEPHLETSQDWTPYGRDQLQHVAFSDEKLLPTTHEPRERYRWPQCTRRPCGRNKIQVVDDREPVCERGQNEIRASAACTSTVKNNLGCHSRENLCSVTIQAAFAHMVTGHKVLTELSVQV